MEGKKMQKPRKPNFSVAECSLILQLAEENLETIREKFSNTLTNQNKQAVWQSISTKVNALGVAIRTTTDVREKWRAMCGVARKEMGIERKSINKTGGGKPTTPPSLNSQRIIEVLGDEPGFSGIDGGIESGTSFAIDEPAIFNTTVAEVVVMPEIDPFSVPDPLQLQDDDVLVADKAIPEANLPSTSTIPTSKPTKKKRKTTHLDIQSMQMDVLGLEKRKIELEVENLELANQKLRLEIEGLKARNQYV